MVDYKSICSSMARVFTCTCIQILLQREKTELQNFLVRGVTDDRLPIGETLETIVPSLFSTWA